MARTIITKSKAAVSLAFFGIIALALSGCTTMSTGAGVVKAVTGPAPITGQTAIDEKAWYGAEALYNVPAQAYVAALDSGQLPASVKMVVKPKLQAMYKVLGLVRTAYKLGDATSFSARVADLRSLHDQVTPLIPGTK